MSGINRFETQTPAESADRLLVHEDDGRICLLNGDGVSIPLDVVLQPSDDSDLAVTTNQVIRATNAAILDNLYIVVGAGTTITSASMLGGAQFMLLVDLGTKQDAITDLQAIIDGAAAGATALQPGDVIVNNIHVGDFVAPLAQAFVVGAFNLNTDHIQVNDIDGDSFADSVVPGEKMRVELLDGTFADFTIVLLNTSFSGSTLVTFTGELPNNINSGAAITVNQSIVTELDDSATVTITVDDAGITTFNVIGGEITSDGDVITQLNDSNEIQVDVASGGIAEIDLRTTNKAAPNNEIIGIGVDSNNNQLTNIAQDINLRNFDTFGGANIFPNEVLHLVTLGRAFIRNVGTPSISIGGVALSTEAFTLRSIAQNPTLWTELTLTQAHSLAQGERLPGDTGTGDIITDNGDGTFTENRTNIPRTLTQVTSTGSQPGDTWLLIDDDLPVAIDETTFPYGIWLLTDTPGGMYVWVFTGTLTQWNRNIAYVPNQIVQLIVGDESTTFEAHTRTGDTLPDNTFNFGIEPGVTVGWEDLWTRINSYTDAARIRVVNTLPGGIATQTSTPSYDDGRVVQDDDIVILSIPIADVLTTIVDKDTIPPGLYRFRILSPTQQTWIRSERGLQWNSNLIYLEGEVVFNSVGSTNAVETPFRALTTVGVNTEPGIHADTDTFWQRLNPYVGELLEEVEDGLRVAQTGGREQIDLFNNPASGNNATPTSWRLTLNEDEQDAANIATLPELIASSKWGTAPTGTRPNPLTWAGLTAAGGDGGTTFIPADNAVAIKTAYESNGDTNAFTDGDEVIVDGWGTPPTGVKPNDVSWKELTHTLVHDDVIGEISGGGELGADFTHPAATNSLTLLVTLASEDERDIAREQFFLPGTRAVGPTTGSFGDARVIDRVQNQGSNALLITFEIGITVGASDGNDSTLTVYTVEQEFISKIEGGTYENGVLTIPDADGGIAPFIIDATETLLGTTTTVGTTASGATQVQLADASAVTALNQIIYIGTFNIIHVVDALNGNTVTFNPPLPAGIAAGSTVTIISPGRIRYNGNFVPYLADNEPGIIGALWKDGPFIKVAGQPGGLTAESIVVTDGTDTLNLSPTTVIPVAGFDSAAEALFQRVDSFGTFQTPALLPTPIVGYDSTTHLVLGGVAYYIHYLNTAGSTSATLTTAADTNTIIFQFNIN